MDDQRQIGTLGALGPFFAVDHHARSASPDAPWQPLTRLLRPTGVRVRIDQVRGALATTARCEIGDVPVRVAASVAHLGLAARLISPQLGALIAGVGALTLDPEGTWWQPVVGGPVPLSVDADAFETASPDAALVVEGVVRTLTDLFEAESVSPRVLWGNVASAVNGAYNAVVSIRPDLFDAARGQVLEALEHPLLRGMSNDNPGSSFRRTNCCLIYRLGPPVGTRQVCGDCVLGPATAG
jgi:hypothetical protein